MATEDDNGDGVRWGDKNAAMLAVCDEKIAALAEQAAAGEDVSAALAALVEDAPDAVRMEIVRRFQEIYDELQESREADGEELSPEMEAQKRRILEREQMLMAHWLSQETLRKIRRALLLNPSLFRQIVSIGEELSKRGIFYDTRRAQVTNADIGVVVLQPDLADAKGKDTGKTRS